MKTVTRTIAAIDAARIKAALTAQAIRYAVQVEGDTATLIFGQEEAQAAADTIAAELAR